MQDRIKAIRKILDLNQTDFGNKIGVKQGSVAAYESGSRFPLDSVIVSICREFNVNETWLRTGEGEMFVKLSRNDEIAAYIARIMKDEDAELQRFLVQLMSRIPSDCWQVIEAKAKELAAEK